MIFTSNKTYSLKLPLRKKIYCFLVCLVSIWQGDEAWWIKNILHSFMIPHSSFLNTSYFLYRILWFKPKGCTIPTSCVNARIFIHFLATWINTGVVSLAQVCLWECLLHQNSRDLSFIMFYKCDFSYYLSSFKEKAVLQYYFNYLVIKPANFHARIKTILIF